MIVLDLQSRVPIYRQIVNGIIEMVLLGVLPEGSQLPSVRSLAMELGTNPNTIQKAYQELESQGVICPVTGRGSFVRGRDAARQVMRSQAVKALEEAARQAALAGLTLREGTDILAAAWGAGEQEGAEQE